MGKLNKKDFLSNTSFIKAVLMIIIVLYHSLLFMNGNWFDAVNAHQHKIVIYFTNYLNSFHIFSFVFISGYLFFYLKNEKNSYTSFPSFIWKKTKRLLIPYLFVLIAWVVPFHLCFYGWNTNIIVSKYVLGESPGQLWFLLMLFLIFVCFWPLSNFFKKWYSIFITVALFVLSFVGSHYVSNYFQIWSVLKFVFFFHFGYLTRSFLGKYIRKVPFWVWIIASLSSFALLCYFNKFSGSLWSALQIVTSFITSILGVLMACSLLNIIANLFNYEKSKFVGIFFKNSMIVYLFHQQIIQMCIWLLYGKVNDYLIALIGFASSIIICLIIGFLLLCNKFTSFLVGERRTNYKNNTAS